ncbi:MAG: phenylalanine 4-monooxygenase [Gemmatimonadota bacterium]
MDDTLCSHLHSPAPASFISQDWASYTAEDHLVWSLLYERRMETLVSTGSKVFLEGAATIGIGASYVPDLADVNARLAERTGWAAVPVSGFLPAKEFFACLAERRFPTTVTVRPMAQLDYLPEPDIFHDVFGHVPLHAHPVFADFLQRFGQAASRARTEAQVEAMARLFWFTVEFGLVHEDGAVKVYGSGLISSHGDAANALGSSCDRRPFSLDAVLAQPFEIDRLQDVLFVVDDYRQLFQAVEEADNRLELL